MKNFVCLALVFYEDSGTCLEGEFVIGSAVAVIWCTAVTE